MCGIVGYTGANDPGLLKAMNFSQVYRGPDDEGYFADEANRINLAMRRLSIVDLEDGHQPMSNNDDSLWIVFNGEIFNTFDLRKELEKEGYSFRTNHSDTETLIYMYQHYGTGMLKYLNGMFAFVIYDKKNRKLFGARDHFGIKPLYYSLVREKFSFASELKSLLKLPWIGREINAQSVYHYFTFQAVPAPATIFEKVQKLPAGHYLEYYFEKNELKTDSYWKPRLSNMDVSELVEKNLPSVIREKFLQAVSRWSLSDVPIGCSLSGGVDSSAIVAAMAQTGNTPVRTYTVGYTDAPDIDETKYAALVARKWNTEHHEIMVRPDDLLKELDRMTFHLDEPYAGGLPSWFVYKTMSKDVKVAMTGSGGDELFGNYGKWKFYENFRSHLYRIRRYIADGGRLSHLLRYPNGSHHYPYYNDGFKQRQLFNNEFIKNITPSAALLQLYWNGSSKRDAVAKVDLRLQLPEEFLLMTDRFSMAFSIEARTPFLDVEFAEFIYSIPSSIRTEIGSLKYLFINAIKDWLPPELLSAPKKGFVLPLDKWLRNELKDEVEALLDKKFLEHQGIFNPGIRKTIVEPFYKNLAHKNQDWRLWELLMFQKWYITFISEAVTQ